MPSGGRQIYKGKGAVNNGGGKSKPQVWGELIYEGDLAISKEGEREFGLGVQSKRLRSAPSE